MNPYTIGIVGSVLVYLLIGTYMGRRVKGIDDYYVAGRSAPTFLIVGTLVASFLSTAAFLGETGFSYQGSRCRNVCASGLEYVRLCRRRSFFWTIYQA